MSATRPPTELSEAGGLGEFGFPATDKVRRGSEIRTILDRGKRKRTASLDVFFMPSPVARPRIGFVVPKHGHRIVDRNVVKRRLKEIGRLELLPMLRVEGQTLDILIRARREAYQNDYDGLRVELVRAMEGICSDGS